MKLRFAARAVARSPASFVRPYALSGFGSSFSVYGPRLAPSKT